MSELRRIMMMFPRPEGSTPSVTVDGYVAFLSDFSDMVSGNRIATDGSVETLSDWSISGYIEIPDDARYVYYDEDVDDQYTGLYDSSKTYIGHITKGNAVSLSAKYLRVSMLTDNISDGIIVILKEQREIPAPVLPYDAEVEYLQSSGTQYIDTQVVLTKNYNVEVDVAFISGASFPTALGSLGSSSNYSVVLGINNNGYPYTQIGGDASYAYYTQNTSYFDSIIRHYVLYSSGNRLYISCNGTTVNAALSGTLSSLTLYLFARHRSDSGVGNYLTGKIGSVSITIDNVLVRDFIPVRKDGVGYMYDRVSGELFGNSGTGSFTYGNDVTT